MTTAKRFEELEVWARARELANPIYDLTDKGTFARDFGLGDQLRRAVISIMSNIAEDFESRTQALFIEYPGRAKACAGELRSQIYQALDHHYLSQDEFDQVFECAEITNKQLARFIQHLETQPNARRIREDGVSYDVQI